MNCDQAREMLCDLLYEELAQDQRRELLAHLAGCPACQAETDKLRGVRSLLAQARANEPAARPVLPAVTGKERSAPARLTPVRRLRLLIPLAAAAALLIAVGWYFSMTKGGPYVSINLTTPAVAAGPTEITRTNVSLTILSAPESAPGDLNINAPYGWRGLALVRDERLVKNLDKGTAEVRFDDVPTLIQPESVRLRSLDKAQGLAILEQNYQFDLASAEAILKRYIDQPITVVMKDGSQIEGKLLDSAADTLVLQAGSAAAARRVPGHGFSRPDAFTRSASPSSPRAC